MKIQYFVIQAVAIGIMCAAAHAVNFHTAGVARCNSCHVIHNSEDGWPIDPVPPGGASHLLRYSTATALCLSCHAIQNGAVWGSNPLAPPAERGAGKFTFLIEDNLNDAPNGGLNPLPGHHGGHNVVAPERGVYADPVHITAPGGSYPSSALGCTSCHDPHGNGNFRMLHGAGARVAGDFVFAYPAPEAVGINLSGAGESRSNHTAYRGGMSRWCANCHGFYHDHLASGFEHDVDRTFGNSYATHYNRYDGSANPNGGSSATSYLPEVAFEDPANTTSSTSGPTGNSRIACISCHRAHGSSAPDLGRWDFNVAYLGQDGQQSGSWPLPNPYNNPQQKNLCAKCHRNGEEHGHGRACLECHREGDHFTRSYR